MSQSNIMFKRIHSDSDEEQVPENAIFLRVRTITSDIQIIYDCLQIMDEHVKIHIFDLEKRKGEENPEDMRKLFEIKENLLNNRKKRF